MKSSRIERAREKERFQRLLLGWFDKHKRDLPWRKNRNPYRVWLSEIMLQQTRVAAVTDYYRKFLRRFPTVQTLAAARESSVLAAWSGLGYYRRARMLHAAAKRIVREHGGQLPSTAEELRSLPGIGRYTSGAIASIAFDEPIAAVDGNVERVLQRVCGTELVGSSLGQIADDLLCRSRPGDFNEAMMELGATVCLPRQPMCGLCPVKSLCVTQGAASAPAKPGRQRKSGICYALHRRNGSVLLVQRLRSANLMPNMWELPEIHPVDGTSTALLSLRHSITTTDYTVRVFSGPRGSVNGGRWISRSRIPTLPLTGLARKILRAAEVI